MSAILTTAKLVCKSPSARTTVITAFRKIIAYTLPHEPEVLQYICAVPIDDSLGTEIYMIEEYANQAASTAHLATPPVQELISLFATTDVLAAPPEVHNSAVELKNSAGPPFPVSSSPAIVLVSTPCKPGSRQIALRRWKDAAQEALNSVRGLSSVTVVDDGEAGSVRGEYVLGSWGDFDGFAGLLEGLGNEVVEVVKVKAVDGFLGREEDKSRL